MPLHLGPTEPTLVHGLRHQARCLTSLPAVDTRSLFIAATWSPLENNEIHVVEVDEDRPDHPLQVRVFQHDAGIQSIAGHPTQLDLIAICEDVYPQRSVTLLRIPHLSNMETEKRKIHRLSSVTTLPVTDDLVQGLVWEPISGQQLCIVATHQITLWSGQDEFKLSTTLSPSEETCSFSQAAWSRHHSMLVATDGSHIRGWDLRQPEQTWMLPFAHDAQTRAIDCNPNVPHYFATGGDDGVVRIWDARRLTHSLLELTGHTHWVWSVAYNPIHDQLILSGGSDTRVHIQSAVSASSAAYGSGDDDDDDDDDDDGDHSTHEKRPTDGLVKTCTDHDDSVYAVTWSRADPWLFASLSYSGRLVFSHVPNSEKYKILL